MFGNAFSLNTQPETLNFAAKTPTARGDRFLTSDGVTGGG
jgi:hypothetical protein